MVVIVVAIIVLWFALVYPAGAAAVTATLRGDGARVTWPGAGCAWHGAALLGCGVGGVTPSRDATNKLQPGDLVVVRSLDGTLIGRAVVRQATYLPVARR